MEVRNVKTFEKDYLCNEFDIYVTGVQLSIFMTLRRLTRYVRISPHNVYDVQTLLIFY